jgi:hypothetical protein
MSTFTDTSHPSLPTARQEPTGGFEVTMSRATLRGVHVRAHSGPLYPYQGRDLEDRSPFESHPARRCPRSRTLQIPPFVSRTDIKGPSPRSSHARDGLPGSVRVHGHSAPLRHPEGTSTPNRAGSSRRRRFSASGVSTFADTPGAPIRTESVPPLPSHSHRLPWPEPVTTSPPQAERGRGCPRSRTVQNPLRPERSRPPAGRTEPGRFESQEPTRSRPSVHVHGHSRTSHRATPREPNPSSRRTEPVRVTSDPSTPRSVHVRGHFEGLIHPGSAPVETLGSQPGVRHSEVSTFTDIPDPSTTRTTRRRRAGSSPRGHPEPGSPRSRTLQRPLHSPWLL